MGTLFLGRMPPFLTSIQQRTAARVQTIRGTPDVRRCRWGGNEGPPPTAGNLRIGKTALRPIFPRQGRPLPVVSEPWNYGSSRFEPLHHPGLEYENVCFVPVAFISSSSLGRWHGQFVDCCSTSLSSSSGGGSTSGGWPSMIPCASVTFGSALIGLVVFGLAPFGAGVLATGTGGAGAL